MGAERDVQTRTCSVADLEAQISSELTRIVESPYPVSLSKLADLLAAADAHTVQKCIHDRPPCVLERLAATVLAALPLWHFALLVLRKLCCCSAFRAQLLQRNPTVLDALLERAAASESDFDKYFDVCVLLLSEPLPHTVPLPASAHTFVLRAFERATKKPCVETLKPVYSMLNGACKGTLAHLPSDARARFDSEISAILSSDSPANETFLFQWCFGIVIEAENVHTTTSESTKDAPERRWKTSAGRKLFGSAHSMFKAIHLASLSVVLTCKENAGVSNLQAIEGLRIATKTLELMSEDARRNWTTRTPTGKSTIVKLMDKVLRSRMHSGIQFQGLCYIAVLLKGQQVPPQLTVAYENTLSILPQLQTDPAILRATIASSLPIYAPHLNQQFVDTILSRILRVCTRSVSFSELQTLSVLVEELLAAVPNTPALGPKVLLFLVSRQSDDVMMDFLRLAGPSAGSTPVVSTQGSCAALNSVLAHNLISSAISLLLSSAVAAQKDGIILDSALVVALIEKQRQLSLMQMSCAHVAAITTPHKSLSVFEEGCTPTGSYHPDWRSRITSELQRQNFHQRESVIRTVAQICHDLESRCEHVEKPLREEKQKVELLEVEVSQLKGQLSRLEAEELERKMFIDGLEAEKLQIEHELDRVDHLNRELSASLEHIKTELANTHKDAEDKRRAAQEEFSAKEIALGTRILEHEDALRERDGKLEQLENARSHSEQRLQEAEEEIQKVMSLHHELQTQMQVVQQDLEAERQLRSHHEEEISRLQTEQVDLNKRISDVQVEKEDLAGQLDSLRLHSKEQAERSEEAHEELRAAYEVMLEEATSKANEEEEKLKSQLQAVREAERELRHAYEATSRKVMHKEEDIMALKAKVEDLTTICAEKDRELHELKALKNRILASMGLTASPLPIRTSGRIPSQEMASPQAQKQRGLDKTHPGSSDKMLEPHNDATAESAMNVVANASFTSTESSWNGPTPKRVKRKSFKVPTIHAPNRQRVSTTRPVSSRAFSHQRRPLSEAAVRHNQSPTRRHTTVGFRLDENDVEDETELRKGRRGSLGLVDAGSFDMSGAFGGTPFTPMNKKFQCEQPRGAESEADTATEL